MTAGPQRPPTTRLRTGAVLVAIVGGIAAAAVLPAAEPRRSAPQEADPSLSIVQGRYVRATPPPNATAGAVLTTARRFAGAYLSCEVGRGDGKTLSVLAAPRLSAALRTTPVRLPRHGRGPTRGRLVALRPRRAGRERWQVDVSIWRSGEDTGLTVTLIRHGRRWLVSGLA
jgi:hypothetical protein